MKTYFLSSALAALFALSAQSALAGSATWGASPPSADWNTATNWTPNTVPNGPADVATFATSNKDFVSFSKITELNSIVFSPGADVFMITESAYHPVTISGAGVINNSGKMQQFICPGTSDAPRPAGLDSAFPYLIFSNNATAGSNVTYTIYNGLSDIDVGGNVNFTGSSSADHAVFNVTGLAGGQFYPAAISFAGSSTAADSTINLSLLGLLSIGSFTPDLATLGNAVVNNDGGGVDVYSSSTCGNAVIVNSTLRNQSAKSLSIHGFASQGIPTAGNATITNQGGNATEDEGTTLFYSDSTAGAATIVNNGAAQAGRAGGSVTFGISSDTGSSAGAATLIANAGTNNGNGGLISFHAGSTGGTARCELFGNGSLDLSAHLSPGVTTGSIEGDGLVLLGARNLTVGANDLSTTFSGVIQDGGSGGGTGGSFTKVGAGSLTLSGANTYTGGTTVATGVLAINSTSGSGTGAVTANGGTLGGSGTISGAVTINSGASLAPAAGTKKQAMLTIQSSVIFNSGSTYTYTFKAKGNKVRTDKVVAKGVTITSGATFSFSGQAQGSLRPGLTFTVLSNTSATPIAGTFSNLPEGAILMVNGNNFQASYAGGDGNDLTLTVVP